MLIKFCRDGGSRNLNWIRPAFVFKGKKKRGGGTGAKILSAALNAPPKAMKVLRLRFIHGETTAKRKRRATKIKSNILRGMDRDE